METHFSLMHNVAFMAVLSILSGILAFSMLIVILWFIDDFKAYWRDKTYYLLGKRTDYTEQEQQLIDAVVSESNKDLPLIKKVG